MLPIILYSVYRGESLVKLQSTIDSVVGIADAIVIINQDVDNNGNQHLNSHTALDRSKNCGPWTNDQLRKQLHWDGQCKVYSNPQRMKRKTWEGYLLLLPPGATLTYFDQEQIQDHTAYYIKIQNNTYQHHHLLLVKNTADMDHYQQLSFLDTTCAVIKADFSVPETYWTTTYQKQPSNYWELVETNNFEDLLQALNNIPFRYEAPYHLLRYAVKHKLYHFGWIMTVATLRNRQQMEQQIGPIRLVLVRRDIETWQFYDLGAHCSAQDGHYHSATNLLTLALLNAPDKEVDRLQQNLENVKNQNGKNQEQEIHS